jgi:hypothetical protein
MGVRALIDVLILAAAVVLVMSLAVLLIEHVLVLSPSWS